ncbi:MAG TPA: pilus assembly PilX N-terminal domain-containing protein [Candidatus Paceibacterota bacterium]
MQQAKNFQSHAGAMRSERGFTLFVALIISSMLLAIGFSLGNIVLKQIVFSSTGKESQIAFYAADSGAECALYWDRKTADGVTTFVGAFAASTTSAEEQDIKCGFGQVPSGSGYVGGFNKVTVDESLEVQVTTTRFHIDYTQPGILGQDPACAVVTVTKTRDSSDPDSVRELTTIDSRGYNAPFTGSAGFGGEGTPSNGACDLSNPRVLERAIVLNYTAEL